MVREAVFELAEVSAARTLLYRGPVGFRAADAAALAQFGLGLDSETPTRFARETGATAGLTHRRTTVWRGS